MKTIFNVAVLAVLFVAPRPCFALWDILDISAEQAKELGLEIRSRAAGPDRVSVALEFGTEGALAGCSGVDLWIGEGDNLRLSVGLREDRSTEGRVLVGFSADRAQLDLSKLRVSVPYRDGGLGGVTYVLRVKDFVESERAP